MKSVYFNLLSFLGYDIGQASPVASWRGNKIASSPQGKIIFIKVVVTMVTVNKIQNPLFSLPLCLKKLIIFIYSINVY